MSDQEPFSHQLRKAWRAHQAGIDLPSRRGLQRAIHAFSRDFVRSLREKGALIPTPCDGQTAYMMVADALLREEISHQEEMIRARGILYKELHQDSMRRHLRHLDALLNAAGPDPALIESIISNMRARKNNWTNKPSSVRSIHHRPDASVSVP